MNTSTNQYYKLEVLDNLELFHANAHTIDFPFHTHETFNISLIINATFNTKLHDKLLQAPMGTISITNPNEVHATPCNAISGNSFFTYYVCPDMLASLNNHQKVFFEDKIIYDQKLFNELFYLCHNFRANLIAFEKRLTTALQFLVSRYAKAKPISKSTQRLFQDFINTSSFETFSLEKTATQFGISKYKFIRLFKQETGLTPNNFVLLKKIETSKSMLKQGYPILDVAIASGFYDTPHFYKYFKRFTGVNPLDFQQALLVV
ncbi:helix-turn-helix domain-containing protein [Aquimarina rhabdastrellae]